MKYDLKKIGKRIKVARKAAGYTQAKLADMLGLSQDSRQTIGKWENGKVLPHFDFMLQMCQIFDCELGYLLCEYDCKTRMATDITSATGLSESAARTLTAMNQSPISGAIETLSKLITHNEFDKLLRAIHLHVLDFNNNGFRIDESSAHEVARYMRCHVSEIRKYMESSSRGLVEAAFRDIISEIK